MTLSVPSFDDLPKVDGMPQGCAWGVFDKDGKKDLRGTLNFLTPEVVAAACKEARDGVSISLNWPLNAIKFPIPGRIDPVHKVMPLEEVGMGAGKGWDDEIHFNTQKSSQWDSLCHWQDPKTGLAYNGAEVTKEGLMRPTTEENELPTLDHWHSTGALVARGVLIDFKAWYEAQAAKDGKTGEEAVFNPFGVHRISISEIEAVAEWQSTTFQHGDMLLIRTGTTESLESLTVDDLAKIGKMQISGVEGTIGMARWLWNHKFSAVAGDAFAFEAMPPLSEDGEVRGQEDLVLHPWLLAMFGMTIGELWDLKKLSKHCAEKGRYSFLLTSAPLNMPGLVGSPPNALAIF